MGQVKSKEPSNCPAIHLCSELEGILTHPNNELVLDLWPTTGKLLHLSRATTYKWANLGTIPVIRIGKKMLVSKIQLERLLAGQTQEKPQ